MIISQPALLCLSSIWNNLAGRSAGRDAQPATGASPAAPPAEVVERAAAIRESRLEQQIPAFAAQVDLPPATHVDLSDSAASTHIAEVEDTPVAVAGMGPLTANERRARASALRALAFSRARRFDAAQTAFQVAATLDPALDLTRVPTFWSLERAAHEAAIAAYVAADRPGDAAVLRARVQSVYRPKALRTRSAAAAT